MTGRGRRNRLLLSLGLVAYGLAIVAFWPVHARVGFDYTVSEYRLPLWRKGWAFIDRDRRTRRLADSLAAAVSATDSETLALGFLDWTHANIRPHPADLRVIDDHVWSIVDRGYGSNDQQADVFTTLLAYAGVPAYWRLIGPERPLYPVALVLVDGEWRVFDVGQRLAMRNERGHLATAHQIAKNPSLVRVSATGRVQDPDAYARRFDGFVAMRPPRVLRAEMQMPGKRLRYELRKLLRADR